MSTHERSFCRFYTCIWVDAMDDKHQAFHLRLCLIIQGSCGGDRGGLLATTYTMTVMVHKLPAEQSQTRREKGWITITVL